MEHPPGLHYLLSEERWGCLWRRVQHRPIAARRRRRTAHVYRQHSAGRGSARWEPRTDWIPRPAGAGVRQGPCFHPLTTPTRGWRRLWPREVTFIDASPPAVPRPSLLCAPEPQLREIVCQCHGGSGARRRLRVFPPAPQLSGSSGENKQVDRRKTASRSDVEVVGRWMNRVGAVSLCRVLIQSPPWGFGASGTLLGVFAPRVCRRFLTFCRACWSA